jgi:hypothetical protein
MTDQPMKITYWETAGEINTDNLLKIVRECALQRDIPVIVASETGKSSLRALHIFGDTSIRMVVVTHYPATTWGSQRRYTHWALERGIHRSKENTP